jgi:glycosyltransferase involved in cell wall biosynthesis
MKVSVVIPTCSKLPQLKLTIASLCNQERFGGEFEVILVNDVSTDATEEYINSLEVPFPIAYLHIDVQRGRSFARN